MNQTITALYLAKNEEEFLPLSVATIISTDLTFPIAKKLEEKYPHKVRVHQFDEDFDKACEFNNRNKALKLVSSSWVMPLDADQLMSDGWYKWVRGPIHDKRYDAIRSRYEHYVGSYEHIHKAFYEKQKNNSLHPEVPLWQTTMFRMRPDLKCTPACLVDDRFREFHHASFDNSMVGRKFYNSGSTTVFHYGFSKRDMMGMSIYRIGRGDYGHDPELKQRMIAELKESGNPFKFIGSVQRVDYGKDQVPNVMRNMFGKTYKLELDKDGFIQSRIHIPSGVKM
jgi:hypothetical protein